MSKTRIAVLGAGWWAAENHIPVLRARPDVEIAGICRLGREELRKAQEHFGIPFGTEDYRELLALEALDGVVISTPHRLHYEHAGASLEKGLHVLCEKPMTLHASEARKLAALAESRQRHFVIPYGWNYTDYAAQAKGLIHQGEIGEVEHVLCHMASALRDLFDGTGAWFAQEAFFHPQKETWSDPAGGGGFAHGQLTHALGLLYWLTNLEPAEVFCFARSSRSGADLYDAISCRFKSGATGMLGGAGTMPPRSTYQVDIRIFGSEGMLLLDIERPRLEVRRNDGRNSFIPLKAPPGEYSCVAPVERFVDLIQGKTTENCSNAALGAAVVATLDAASRSAKSGKIEEVSH
ncbi:MAG TPA: Gfo/Idh/MocA family oxidoreductase [Terriglobales bacterium]|nr:Gfo/Idh/MocA family oxidoreductase [Terriglobia bacterium]HZU41445.1 Gfo/Idh/MocA family oxidoreductase [Terriglobales bacterium]